MATSDMEDFVATQCQLLARDEWLPQADQVTVLVQPSIAIGVENSGIWGTFGCFLKKADKLFALTNGHVVGQVPQVQIAVAGGHYVIGKAKSGAIRNPGAGIDAAVVEINPDILSSKKKYSVLFPDGTHVSGPAKAEVDMRVWFWGAKTGRKQPGTVKNINANATVNKVKWSHLIEFEFAGGSPIPGDSGSVLVDDFDRVVGLVFSSDYRYYGNACHIDKVLEALGKQYSGEFTFPNA